MSSETSHISSSAIIMVKEVQLTFSSIYMECKMREIMKEHRPQVLILLKPRISGDTADVVCKKLGKKWIRSETARFSGGVWVKWDDDEISLNLVYAHRFFLHLIVRSVGGLEWELIAVYASPSPSIRRHLWDKLDKIEANRPWVLVG